MALPELGILENSKSRLPAAAPRRAVGFPSSVAEFLLMFRLRVRRRSALGAVMLERAVRIVVVTCKSWFCGMAGRAGSGSVDRR